MGNRPITLTVVNHPGRTLEGRGMQGTSMGEPNRISREHQ